jgi:hypothetical protein
MNTITTRAPRSSRLFVIDLIAMITLAIGVGLATGIVLGGTVLLFSSSDSAQTTTLIPPATGVPSH